LARSLQNSSATKNGDDIVSSLPGPRLLFDANVSVLVNVVADVATNSSTKFATGLLQLVVGEPFGLA
jgi:hypothetical protein